MSTTLALKSILRSLFTTLGRGYCKYFSCHFHSRIVNYERKVLIRLTTLVTLSQSTDGQCPIL